MTDTLSAQLRTLQQQLNEMSLEREDAIEAALLAVLSGERLYMLGPPGADKSRTIRALVSTISGARYFETPLSKHRPPEAVLGPLDIKEFRENGNYFLKRKGYASQVEFVFLDEVGKMSPILGHDLLALLNERVYHEVNGGLSVHPSPLSTAFTASNEVITDESEGGAALWDQLLFRVVVDYLKNDDNFTKLVSTDLPAPTVKIDWEDLRQAIALEVPAVAMTATVLKGMKSLRHALAREKIFPSDRRWRQSVKALKAHAFLDGRTEVRLIDIAALRFTLWDTVAQIERVERLCKEVAHPGLSSLLNVTDMVKEIEGSVEQRIGESLDVRGRYAHEAIAKLKTAHEELATLEMSAGSEGESIPGLDEAKNQVRNAVINVAIKLMDQDEEAAEIVMVRQLGRAL